MKTKIFTESNINSALIDNQYTLMLNYIKQRKEYKRQKLIASKIRTCWIKPKDYQFLFFVVSLILGNFVFGLIPIRALVTSFKKE